MSDEKFTEVEGAAWGNLISVHAAMSRRLEKMLEEEYKISHGEFEVLLRLSWATGNRLRILELAERSLLTRSGMSRLVERLVSAGLVRREAADEDKRGAYAVLTPAGQDRLKVAEAANIALVKKYFTSLYTPEELSEMALFWKRFLQHEEDLAKEA